MPDYVEDEFFEFLKNIDLTNIKIYAIRQGSIVFPRVPIMRLEGPLPVVQLLETTLLVLINYARYLFSKFLKLNKEFIEFSKLNFKV
jgi:nicotinate phosphoribosyltransferase